MQRIELIKQHLVASSTGSQKLTDHDTVNTLINKSNPLEL